MQYYSPKPWPRLRLLALRGISFLGQVCPCSVFCGRVKFRPENRFVKLLGALEGDEFQREVCTFLRRCITDFQDVPAKPHGDAGLDGLSHGQTRCYCCYGPEQEPFKKNVRGLTSDILRKFRDDLATIFELKVTGKGKKRALVDNPTNELPTILAQGRKISAIRLVVSVFETHRLIGPLNTTLSEYVSASKQRFVVSFPALTIWGPKQLAGLGAVDDVTLMRLEGAELLRRVDAAMKDDPSATVAPSEFEEKFDWLEAQTGTRTASVGRLRDRLRKQWGRAVALDDELANNAAAIHEGLSRAREAAALDAELASSSAANATEILQTVRDKIGERLDSHLEDRLPPDLRGQLIDCELARLIGECPIDWREEQ